MFRIHFGLDLGLLAFIFVFVCCYLVVWLRIERESLRSIVVWFKQKHREGGMNRRERRRRKRWKKMKKAFFF